MEKTSTTASDFGNAALSSEQIACLLDLGLTEHDLAYMGERQRALVLDVVHAAGRLEDAA